MAIGGSDWSAQALVHGQFVIDRPAVTPRGGTPSVQVRGSLGLGDGLGWPHRLLGRRLHRPACSISSAPSSISSTSNNVLYGGSLAGAFVDANADPDTPAATMFTDAQDPPMYRLFVDTDTCEPVPVHFPR